MGAMIRGEAELMETYRSKTHARWGPSPLRYGDATQTPARTEGTKIKGGLKRK